MPSADTLVTDISPEVGITGTPVIDRAAELLYVVSKAKRADGTYVQRLHALHLAGDTFTIKDFFSPHDTATLRHAPPRRRRRRRPAAADGVRCGSSDRPLR